jgi:hypothetical protein
MKTDEELEEFLAYSEAAYPALAELFDADRVPPEVLKHRIVQWRTSLKGPTFGDCLEAVDAMIAGRATGPRFGTADLGKIPQFVLAYCRSKHSDRWHTEVPDSPPPIDRGAITRSMRADGEHCRKLLVAARVCTNEPDLDPRNVPAVQEFLTANY